MPPDGTQNAGLALDDRDLRHFGNGGFDATLDPVLDGQIRNWTAAARPDEPNLHHSVLVIVVDEFDVAPVDVQGGTDGFQSAFDPLGYRHLCGRSGRHRPRVVHVQGWAQVINLPAAPMRVKASSAEDLATYRVTPEALAGAQAGGDGDFIVK
jgi:hypothetical protein